MSLRIVLLLAVATLFTSGCQTMHKNTPELPDTISGELLYKQRIALPPDATIEVIIEDITEAPPTVLARSEFASEGRQVPIPYQVAIDRSKVDSSHNYSLKAVIRVHGGVMFETTGHHPVLKPGHDPKINLLLDMTGSVTKPTATLINTYWKLTELNGGEVVVMNNIPETHIILQQEQNSITGMGGINRLMGTYELSGSSLRLEKVGSTLMAGPEPLMKQERAFLDALKNTATYHIEGENLELRDATGKTLARFQAVYLR